MQHPNKKYQDFYEFVLKQEINENTNMEVREYDEQDDKIISMFLQNQNTNSKETQLAGMCNTTTYSLKKGILKYENKDRQVVDNESSQLHNREVFKPVMLSDLTKEEKDKAVKSLILLTEKRDGTIKARACANGSTQRIYIDKHKAAITKALLTTAVMDEKQYINIITLDIPNAFVQSPMPEVIMRINELLLQYLDEIFPSK